MSSEKLEALMWRATSLGLRWGAKAHEYGSMREEYAEGWARMHNGQITAARAIGVEEVWNALLRHADIVAARIDGLREGAKIVQAEFFMKPRDNGYESWETPCFDDVEPALNARIAELEATAPEVSEVRAKAEAFDAALAYLKDANAYYAWWMENALAEAKRKGAGT